MNKRPFGARRYSDVLSEGLQYIDDRRHGRIKSIKTPWAGFNKAGVGGLEWGSMLTIGARPGAGKTLIVSQLLRESRVINLDQDFNILEFQFEMGPKQSSSRAFAAEMALDYNTVLSTDRQLDDFIFDRMRNFQHDQKILESHSVIREVISEPLTHHDIKKAAHHWYNDMGGKPMIMTIDHSWLLKKAPDEKEKLNTLYNAVEMLMQLKKELPVIIIMITQLNRNMEEPLRKTPGTIGNYPTSSDVFGGDALMQGSDMLVALSRPAKNDIAVYGPKGYLVKTDDIFMHLLKTRNGADDITALFMKAEFQKQRMIEVSEPACSNPSGGGFRRLSQRQQTNISNDINLDNIS